MCSAPSPIISSQAGPFLSTGGSVLVYAVVGSLNPLLEGEVFRKKSMGTVRNPGGPVPLGT